MLFLGDAAAQHSPFGARGGNRAIQDANNLAWKLALALEGRAHPDLVQTYEEERHYAAREAVEIASRSAIFIGPETEGQRLVRNAILELAQRHDWARAMVNVGRLSVACTYADSPLNRERGEFDAPLAQPGAAAPDGRFGAGFFVERLQGQFTTAYFGGDGPELEVPTLTVPREGHEALFARYGVTETATYVFRPDGHVLARCTGIDPEFAKAAIDALLDYHAGGAPARKPAKTRQLAQLDLDRRYDALAALVDRTPPAERERVLARLVMDLREGPRDKT